MSYFNYSISVSPFFNQNGCWCNSTNCVLCHERSCTFKIIFYFFIPSFSHLVRTACYQCLIIERVVSLWNAWNIIGTSVVAMFCVCNARVLCVFCSPLFASVLCKNRSSRNLPNVTCYMAVDLKTHWSFSKSLQFWNYLVAWVWNFR